MRGGCTDGWPTPTCDGRQAEWTPAAGYDGHLGYLRVSNMAVPRGEAVAPPPLCTTYSYSDLYKVKGRKLLHG